MQYLKILILASIALLSFNANSAWDSRPTATASQWAAVLGIQPGQKKGFGTLFRTNSDSTAYTNVNGGAIENYVKTHPNTGLYSIAVRPDTYTNNPIQVFYTPTPNKTEAANLCALMGAHLLKMASNNNPGVWRHIVAPLAESRPFYPNMTAYAVDVWRELNILNAITHDLYNNVTVFPFKVAWSADNFSTGLIDLDVAASGYYVVNPNDAVYNGTEFTHYLKYINSGYLFGDVTDQYYGTGNIPSSPVCEWNYQDIYQIW